MAAEKARKISCLIQAKKPQLACRHDAVHASCTIPKRWVFVNALFLKGFYLNFDLAQCLQYPC